MTKWVKFSPDIIEEAEEAFGEGPFPVLKQTDSTYEILIKVEMPKRNVVECSSDKTLERIIKQSIGSVKNNCSCKLTGNEIHPLAGYISTAKKISSPYTSKFKVGEKVVTPVGKGNILEVNFKTIKVEIPQKGVITWDYYYIEKPEQTK